MQPRNIEQENQLIEEVRQAVADRTQNVTVTAHREGEDGFCVRISVGDCHVQSSLPFAREDLARDPGYLDYIVEDMAHKLAAAYFLK